MAEPKSTKPYLLRAVYEWCVDNGYTPHISVVVDSRTRVPMEYVRNGEIVLNVGPVRAFFRGRQGPRHSGRDRRGDLRKRKRTGYVVRAGEKGNGRGGERRRNRRSTRPEGPPENRRKTRVEADQVRSKRADRCFDFARWRGSKIRSTREYAALCALPGRASAQTYNVPRCRVSSVGRAADL